MVIVSLYSVVIFIIGFELILCSFRKPLQPRKNIDTDSDAQLDPDIVGTRRNVLPLLTTLNIKPLQEDLHVEPDNDEDQQTDDSLWKNFSSYISSLLSPEIFSQHDPALYFLEKIVKLPDDKVLIIDFDLRYLLHGKNKLPERYIPYANALSKLTQCVHLLRDVTRFIKSIPPSSLTEYSSLPPANFFTRAFSELRQLFSYDIFSDEKAPFQLVVKLMNIPMDKIDDMKTEFQKLHYKKRFPKQYSDYVQQMLWVSLQHSTLKKLKQSITQLKNISTLELAASTVGGQNSNEVLQSASQSNVPTTGMPLLSNSVSMPLNET